MDPGCQIMAELSSSIFLRIILIYSLISCLIAFPLVLWTTYKIWFTKSCELFHINILIIIQVHFTGFLIHCFGRIVLHSLDLYNYSLDNPCDMLPEYWRCILFRFFYVGGQWLTSATVVPLVIERLIATWKSDRYENHCLHFGILMMFLQVFMISVPVAIYAVAHLKNQVPMPYCALVHTDRSVNLGQFINILIMISQIISRIIFHYLFKWNQNQRIAKLSTSTLSNRYQLEENLKSMQNLKVFANLTSGYFIIQAAIFMGILSFDKDMERPEYFALIELNGSSPIFAILTVLILIKMVHKNKKSVRSSLDFHVNADSTAYFDQFKKSIS